MHNLVSAAAATGVNRSTILRAIKAGRISAQRDETNGWQIDPAELHRVFPPLPSGATTATQLGATTDALVAELRAVIADLRRDRDAWREAFENAQRLLPRPTQPDASAGRLLPIHVVAYPPDACWLHLALPAIPRRASADRPRLD